MPVADGSRLGAAARADELRRAVGAAADPALRARLRVQLAELVRVHDSATALDELRAAAAEAPGLPAVTMSALSLARALPPSERLKWLSELGGGGPPVPAWLAALAEAHAQIGAVDRAAAAWLALARDERTPPHRRRVAARRAESLAAGVAPDVQRAALRLSAGFTQGRGRLAFLRRALALAGPHTPADELLALAGEWLDAGGDGRVADAALARARAGGAAPSALERLSAEAARRGPRMRGETLPSGMTERRKHPRPARPGEGARRRLPPPTFTIGGSPGANAPATPDEILDAALAQARGGHANRAHRLAAEGLRGAPLSDALAARVAAVEGALRESGYIKQALQVRRTYVEGLAEDAQRAAVTSLAAEAEEAGLSALARAWRADAGLPPAPAAPAAPQPVTPADHYLHAQRLLAQLPPAAAAADGSAAAEAVGAALAALVRALAAHPGADEALALADALSARLAAGEELERQRLELLRTAHAGEADPARRLRLAERLARALERLKDPVGAIAVLERTIEAAGPGEGARLRRERARLLREIGRGRDLAAALEGDAGALAGDERLGALTERAALLDGSGEPERALEVRLMTLAEFPADLAVLGAARRRLESTGRPAESLRLAVAAVDRVPEGAEKLRLLRDIAVLSEKSAGNPAEAAAAWLAVLESDPEDGGACEAAERLLLAVGDWERCADLLSWAAARVGAGRGAAARASRLWRLAELRRARLGQPEEALRLYGELRATAGAPQEALADGADLAAVIHRDPVLRLETARAVVAPTPADRARALIDRAVALLDRGRPGDAEADGMLALDLDPTNVDIIRVLERIHDGGSRWADLGQQLRQRAAGMAPVAAARLFYGVGRAAERLGDRVTAREAYRRALSLDGAFPEPIGALGALAARDGDWNEVAALLQSEVALTGSPARKGRLLAELAAVHGERLANVARAVELLDAALALLPDEVRILDLASRFNLQAGRWEVAALALDRLASSGAAIPDAAERYYQAGAAAEAAGAADRGLILYSRSYARQSSYRPTLERLSAICFARDQWDNAWKATEALLERHGPALERSERAALLVRSALADLHIGQRAAAQARLAMVVTRGGSFIPDVGIRDVAESWGGMRLEPRLLAAADRMRRERAAARAGEAVALTGGAVRRQAWEILGALAVVEGRWDEALAALRALADDEGVTPAERAGFLVAAGDIHVDKRGDREGGERLYAAAASLHPHDGRLITRLPGAAVAEDLAHEVTDEMPV
jgi:tetratricopeptide (TPR) repeat protein